MKLKYKYADIIYSIILLVQSMEFLFHPASNLNKTTRKMVQMARDGV